jgi:BirA family biotin operon repressor/biotin-[acetyl-CoA-carboxylase] ligase
MLQVDLSKRGFAWVQLNDTLDSTNLEAKRQAYSFSGKGIFIAKEQTLGKGRRGRTWESPKGTGHYMSLLYRPEIEPAKASMVTLLAGLAVCNALNDLYHLEARIKWPNDIVVGKKKLCGILTEMNAEIEVVNYIVIGIGINISQVSFPDSIVDIATSILMEQGLKEDTLDKHALILAIVDYLDAYMLQFSKRKDLSFIRGDYEALCVNISGELRIESFDDSYIGIGKGISEYGHLYVEKEDGNILEVNAGEVSVRGIYGYL